MKDTWISFDHSIPPTKLDVLLYLEDGTQAVGYRTKEDEEYVVGGWECCHYCGGMSIVCAFNSEDKTANCKIATHWRHLPEKPMEKE